jgi:OmcA/MtrC family decaheme c-type cytochrome
MTLRNLAPALVALLIGALTGCGGGGGGGGSASVSAAATGGTITGITVNSAPVVTFVVRDSAGNAVTGLTLYKAGYDGHCGSPAGNGNYTANVAFAIAKFDGANWQSLISRQRYATSAPGQYSVIEGTTDPTNPTELLPPSAPRVVGQLSGTNGVYTYQFATDVTTPQLLASAASGDLLGKVANNGNLAVKDGKTLHRVALQLCFVDPVSKQTIKLNPYLDFMLGANGTGVPFKDSQGNPVPAREVADRASCNECHLNFAHHNQIIDPVQPDTGAYIDPQACVMCHNPGSSDFVTGNPIDFKLMVHRFHMGKRLTQDYAVGAAVARIDAAGVITGVLYPQDQRNCVKCHDGSATASHRTAQGNNWKTMPSKNACWACHDDYKTAGSKWQTAHALYASFFSPGVSNPDATPDSVCQSCHNDAGTGVASTIAKEHEITEWVMSKNYQLNIWGISKNTNNSLTVEYSVSNPNTGTDYDLLDTALALRFSNLGLLFGWNTTDYANDGGNGRGQPFSVAATDASVQRVGTSNHFKLTSTVLPAAASGTIAVAFQGRVDESGLHVPVPNVVKYFSMSGGAALERRQVVSADKCNACHGKNLAFTNVTTFQPGLGAHDANRNDPQVCVICHNGNNPLDGTIVTGGVVTQYAESADFKRMIHMMHAQQADNYPVWPLTKVATNLNTQIYAGLKNCDVCHENGSYKQNQSVLGTSVTFDVDASGNVTDTDAADNAVISPKASTCASCHDSDGAKTHMIDEGGAAFGTVTQGALATGSAVFEKCDGCHLPGAIKPVDLVHLGVTN